MLMTCLSEKGTEGGGERPGPSEHVTLIKGLEQYVDHDSHLLITIPSFIHSWRETHPSPGVVIGRPVPEGCSVLGYDFVRWVPSENSKGCVCADAPLPRGAN
jgi:hypothetical protein